MTIDLQLIGIFIGGLLSGMLIVLIIMRFRYQSQTQNLVNEHHSELKLQSQQIESLEEDRMLLTQDFENLKSEKKEADIENKNLLAKFSATRQQFQDTVQRLEELKKQVLAFEEKQQFQNQENSQLKSKVAELKTLNEQQQQSAAEKLELLSKARQELQDQFKSLANEIFDEKGKKFAEQNKEKLDAILNPFNSHLQEFKKVVSDVYVSEAKQRASLKQEILGLKELNERLNKEALNLTTALKGDKKTQGNWGELVLERVLEQSGLRKGQEYETQGGFRDAENNLLKPDVIIHLPQEKAVIVDSKVSLIAYEKYSSSENPERKEELLKQHINAVESHIKSLSEKDYSNIKGIQSLDFVLMFIPIEPAFNIAFQNNDKLFNQAFEKKIIVVTPTTLLATLKTIENLWRYENQNRNARIIAEKAGNLYDKFRGFVEDIEKLGNQINTVNDTYQNALNKLSKGKGNLISQSQQLVDLGVKVKKEIPKSILDESSETGSDS
ncbi:MAG: DNA recombination protein RmuC [Gammaproteobacteria bacterium]